MTERWTPCPASGLLRDLGLPASQVGLLNRQNGRFEHIDIRRQHGHCQCHTGEVVRRHPRLFVRGFVPFHRNDSGVKRAR